MRKAFFLIWLSFALALAGCVSAPSSVADEAYAARIIVKFSDLSIHPAERSFLEDLSHDAGITLIHVRPMSGGAHVFEARGLRDAAELQEVLRRLSKRSGVAYVEEDRVRRKP